MVSRVNFGDKNLDIDNPLWEAKVVTSNPVHITKILQENNINFAIPNPELVQKYSVGPKGIYLVKDKTIVVSAEKIREIIDQP